MATASDQAYHDYKRAEAKALELMRAMRQTAPRPADIELALLVAIFELHKGTLPGATVTKIIQGHLEVLASYYTPTAKTTATPSSS